MKNEEQTVNYFEWFILIALAAFVLCVSACSPRTISGKIKSINGNMVKGEVHTFKVYDTTGLYIGKPVTFTPTVNRRKINSKKLN